MECFCLSGRRGRGPSVAKPRHFAAAMGRRADEIIHTARGIFFRARHPATRFISTAAFCIGRKYLNCGGNWPDRPARSIFALEQRAGVLEFVDPPPVRADHPITTNSREVLT
jgi:hypothetical protein